MFRPFRADPIRLWNISFLIVFLLLGLLGGWWTVLIDRLVNQNYQLELALGGSAAQLAEHHERQRLMILGESTLLLLVALGLIGLAWRQTQRERAHIRRLEGMLAASSHELKTPVAAVRSLLESLQSGVLPADRAGPYLERGLASCHRLEHLVESILAYQAVVARPQPLSTLPLGAWVEPVLEHRRDSVPRQRFRVALEGVEETEVYGAADPIRVILENLMDNAEKYGGGGEVVIGARREGSFLEVTVTDTGQGFSADEAETLFEPYQRGEPGKGRHGTGLGLYLSRNLARSMGGDLLATSPGPGKGSTFSLRLRRA